MNMSKQKMFWFIAVAAAIIVALTFLIYRNLPSASPVNNPPEEASTPSNIGLNEAANEPNIGFTPVYQEANVPLSQVPNYEVVKTKYGLNLSDTQEKFLAANRFLLVTYDQVPFFKTGINFDQWLHDLSLIHISEPTRRTPISY